LVLARGICFGLSAKPQLSDSVITVPGDTGIFVCTLSRLSANTAYFVRAFARTNDSVYYGNAQSFKTARYIDSPVTLYAGIGSVLYAVNAQTGKLKWQVSFPSTFYSSPFYANGMVFIGCNDSKLYAIDSTGSERWSVSVANGAGLTPIAKDGLLYKVDGLGNLFVYDVATGAQVWSAKGAADNNVTLSNGLIYINNDYLQALDGKTGAVKWSSPAGLGTPVVVNNRVYTLGLQDYIAYEYDANTGALIKSLPGDQFNTTNFFLDGVQLNMYHGNFYGIRDYPDQRGLVVYDSLGTLKWTANVAVQSPGGLYNEGPQPFFSDSAAYLYDENAGMVCYNAYTGAILSQPPQTAWRRPTSLTIANGILYYQSDFLYAVDPATRTSSGTIVQLG
jgi:outer membrane protein assembly factor BamB